MKGLETRIPPPAITLIAMGSMWASNKLLPWFTWIAPAYGRVGIAVAAMGLGVLVVSFITFSRAGTTIDPVHPESASRLVTHGIFSYSRNPMYVGFLLILTGWAIWLRTASPWFMIPAVFAYFSVFQIAPEERALLVKFGRPYEAYVDRVGRWIPFI